MEKNDKTLEWTGLIIGLAGIFACLFGLVMFNRYVVMLIPLIPRMAVVILSYWVIAAAPIAVMIVSKDKLSDLGFAKEKIGLQILIGVVLGIGMSLVLTLVPHLARFGSYVYNSNRYWYFWQFIFEFVYCIISVAFTEEFVFRGLLYEKIRRVSNSEIAAVIGSSMLFGVFHIFTGNLLQVFMTALIGLFFCVCRLKIKNCSTLSLIIAHGVYDAMISVWIFVFLR